MINELKGAAAEAVTAVSGQRPLGRRHGRAADQSFCVGIPSMFGSLSHQPPGPVKMLIALCWWWHTPHDAQDGQLVRVAIEGAFPLWNALDFHIHDLCRRAKVECQLESSAWATLVPGLNVGKYDLVMTLGINEKRKKMLDFTAPYASGVASFLVLKNGPLASMPMRGERLNFNDKTHADPVMATLGTMLKGKTVWVVQSTSHELLMNTYFGDDITVRTYRSSAERDLDLKAGRIDAGFDSGVYARSVMAKPGNDALYQCRTGSQRRDARH